MTTGQPAPVAPLVEHFFRHEAGRLVSVLTRIFGWANFDLVEDMVQATLLDCGAGVARSGSGRPRRGSTGWRTDHRCLEAGDRPPRTREVGWHARRGTRRLVRLFVDSGKLKGSQLRMMFACCIYLALEPAHSDVEARFRQLGNRSPAAGQ